MTDETDPTAAALSVAAFPPPDEAAWRRRAEKALKGAPFERLRSRTLDGIDIEPLYARATGPAALAHAHDGPWRILTRIDHSDAAMAAEQARADVEGGANGLHLVFAGAPLDYGFGLSDAPDDLESVLAAIDLHGLALELDLGADPDVATRVATAIEAQGLDPASAQVSFGLRRNAEPTEPGFAARAKELAARGFRGPLCVADGRPVHAAGGTEAQELAFALAEAVETLRALEAGGMALDDARRAISFRLCADADQFASMSKLRALRRLWARVEESCGLQPVAPHLHAETAWRMMTRRDPWVNVLRATVAAFSAGVGGVDALTVLPFTQALGLPDAFARRLARNTQLVLIEEAHVGHVADPAAGAGGFEALTDALAREAWRLFQSIERAGGAARGFAGLEADVARARAIRLRDAALRKTPITGVSFYPNLAEEPQTVLAFMPEKSPGEDASSSALAPMRLSQPFEDLRDASDADLARTGRRPQALLVALGPIAAASARIDFARGLFEAGGCDTSTALAASDPEDTAAAFATSGAHFACLCGTDAAYADAEAHARALKKGGARRVFLAGRPGDREAALRSAGVDDFVHIGCDVVLVLQNARTQAD